VEELSPEVLASLRASVLPTYAEIWTTGANSAKCPDRSGWETSQAIIMGGAFPHLAPVTSALQKWATDFHLTDPWLIDLALFTLNTWTRYPEVLELEPAAFQMPPSGHHDTKGIEPPHLPMWRPTLESWADYEARTRAWFEATLRTYKRETKEYAASRGIHPTPQKRPRGSDDVSLHFEWLVRYQVQGWSFAKIAAHYDKGFENVSKTRGHVEHSGARQVSRAVRETADYLRLRLRPPGKNQHDNE
jgi:hypothetical protein